MTARGWQTITAAPLYGEPQIAFAYPDGTRREYPAVALLVQENDAQQTRTVLGFRDGAHIVASDQIAGFAGVVAESSASFRGDVMDRHYGNRRPT